MSETTFKWIISGLVGAVLALIGLTYNNLTNQLTGMEATIEQQSDRIGRLNTRLFTICERLIIIEIATNNTRGSCGYE